MKSTWKVEILKAVAADHPRRDPESIEAITKEYNRRAREYRSPMGVREAVGYWIDRGGSTGRFPVDLAALRRIAEGSRLSWREIALRYQAETGQCRSRVFLKRLAAELGIERHCSTRCFEYAKVDRDKLREIAEGSVEQWGEITRLYNKATRSSLSRNYIHRACKALGIERHPDAPGRYSGRKSVSPLAIPVETPPASGLVKVAKLSIPADRLAAYREVRGDKPQLAETREAELAARERLRSRSRRPADLEEIRAEYRRIRRNWVRFRRDSASA